MKVAGKELAIEREQLLNWWADQLIRRNRTNKISWREKLETGVAKYFATLRSQEDGAQKSRIRGIHNKLGFKALGSGLCKGAIFRTDRFIDTINRVGTKSIGQTIHIEHTVPIAELDRQLRARFIGQPEAALNFLLKYSVCTAFTMEEKSNGVAFGYERKTDAFVSDHADYGKPFQRYGPLFEGGAVIWNVFDGVPIDPHKFDFDQHYDIVQRLIAHCG